jgi:hypothetical protein
MSWCHRRLFRWPETYPLQNQTSEFFKNSEVLRKNVINANKGQGVTLKVRGFFVVFFAKVHAQKTPQAVKTTDKPSF